MTPSLKLPAAFIPIMLLRVVSATKDTVSLNAREYSLLCRFYNLGEPLYAESKEGEALSERYNEMKKTLVVLNQAIQHLNQRKNVTITRSIERKVQRFKVLVETAGVDALRNKYSDVNVLLKEALYGEHQTKFVEAQSIAAGTYAVGCGGTKVGNTGPGKSLANDLLCLCAGKEDGSSSKTGNTCTGAETLNSASEYYKNSGGFGDAAWTKLTKECQNKDKPQPTPGNINSLIAEFYGILGKNLAASTSAPEVATWALGRPHTDGQCDGNTKDYTCVIYAKQMSGAAATGIPWIIKMIQASQKMVELRDLQEKEARLLARLQHYNESIWDEIEVQNSSSLVGVEEGNQESKVSKYTQNDRREPAVSPVREASGPSSVRVCPCPFIFVISAILLLR